MNVNIGSFSDPKNAEGLAHFLEHMLFMGSKKYPFNNKYWDFITLNGGNCNAYTNIMNTVYYY